MKNNTINNAVNVEKFQTIVGTTMDRNNAAVEILRSIVMETICDDFLVSAKIQSRELLSICSDINTAEKCEAVLANEYDVQSAYRNPATFAIMSADEESTLAKRNYSLWSACKKILALNNRAKKELEEGFLKKFYKGLNNFRIMEKDMDRFWELIYDFQYLMDSISSKEFDDFNN